MEIEAIKQLILQALPLAQVHVNTNDGRHFFASVIADEFKNLSLIARQRLVYKALGDAIKNGEIHAISIKTYTEEELNV